MNSFIRPYAEGQPAQPAELDRFWTQRTEYRIADYAPGIPPAVANLLTLYHLVLVTRPTRTGAAQWLMRPKGHPDMVASIRVNYRWTLEEWVHHVTNFDKLTL